MSKKILDLLEKALKIKNRVSPDYSEDTIKLAFDEVMVIIEDVLTLQRNYPIEGETDNPDPPPTSQPKDQPSSEFTATIRHNLKVQDQAGDTHRLGNVYAELLKKLCDRLDTSESENKELKHNLLYAEARFEEVQDNNKQRDVIIEQLESENQKLREQLENPDIEQISETVHKAYCEQYKKKHGKEYWTKGDYSLLDEETKEFDRATVRAVLQAKKG